jgi:hypothetical protein
MAGVLSEGVLQEQASHLDGREGLCEGATLVAHWWGGLCVSRFSGVHQKDGLS